MEHLQKVCQELSEENRRLRAAGEIPESQESKSVKSEMVKCDQCQKEVLTDYGFYLSQAKIYVNGQQCPLRKLDFCNVECLDDYIRSLKGPIPKS